jgi:endonuclease/exonuclease/phosphatase family metal-dependent hydrolase
VPAVRAWLLSILLVASMSHAESFSLLTYNIRGLPPVLTDDGRDEQVSRIAESVTEYDVVLLQEVFGYDDLVHQAANPRQLFHGPEPRLAMADLPVFLLGYVPCRLSRFCELPTSAGLAVLVFDDAIDGTLLVSRPYSSCNGYLGSASDCLARKGFLGVSLRVGGMEVHVYNTHLDAGRSAADRDVRRRQLAEMARSINRLSRHVPVIVAGDFNLRRADGGDMDLRDAFLESTGLTDTGVLETEPCAFGCKGVDAIFYRGTGMAVRHAPAGLAPGFVDACGEALSDHPPLRIEFGPKPMLAQSGD